MIDTNLKGTIFCTQQVIHEMKERNQGTIINILPTSGLEGKANESVYSASKFGVRGFTESLSKELEDTKIHVAAFYIDSMGTPFWQDTPQANRVNEMLDPANIADIIIQNTQERNKINIPQVVIRNQ
jgi:short-subunit dehydrogenase